MPRFQSHMFWKSVLITALALVHYIADTAAAKNERFEADIVVYGGTSSGVIAAVQAKKMGKSAILVGPDKHLGGLTSGGLGFTDTGSVCVSSSHIAFGSMRMEPMFMILGQSAATGAVLALDGKRAVQDVPYSLLREQLLNDGQVLEYASANDSRPDNAGKRYIDPTRLPGIVVDDNAARLTGQWKTSSASADFIGPGYRHDSAAKDGSATARYETKLLREGRYEVLISWPPHSNRSPINLRQLELKRR